MLALKLLNSLAVLAIGIRAFATALDPGVLPQVYVFWAERESMMDIYVGRPPWDQSISFLWVVLTLGLVGSMAYAIGIFFRETDNKLAKGLISLAILVMSWFLYPLFQAATPDLGATGLITFNAVAILLALLPYFISSRASEVDK